MPTDIEMFLTAVAGLLVVGLPLIMFRVSVPRRVAFEVLAEHELTSAQARLFTRLDAELLELGYRPAGNRRTANMQGRALIRTYLSAADPAVVMMNLMASGVEGAGEHPMNYLEIVTSYQDGTTLATRNAEISDVLETLPGHLIQERKGLRSAAKLKAEHDRKAAELLVHGPLHMRPEDFERVFDEFHQRWCEHQIGRGLLTPVDNDPTRLRPTVKAGLRGIANFLNPLADNFSWPRLAAGLLVGIALPTAAGLWLAGPGGAQVERLAAATGLSPLHCTLAGFALLLTLTGAVVGWLFTGKAFVWSFLLCYLPLRLVAPLAIGATAILSLWAGVVAGWAAARRERRALLA
ncbi:MAG: hypothetical protein MUE90_06845 [Thermoanaerobaculales bacterium]|nr:hypothetical protein [Thermoanaerobaculales bacterium]